ncbi:MAG TPA: RICIN domain-containing protein [Verrucomicrobiae bacterium]|nr:RICIN domain-containing protein [Verrucomicrobiae bacterium]
MATIILLLTAFLATAESGAAAQIIMGNGTEWYHWRGVINSGGVTSTQNLYTIMKNSQIPTRLEKTYIPDTSDVSHFQDLLNNGVCPVILEGNQIQAIYRSYYPNGNDWDPSHVWNSTISSQAYAWLNNVLAPLLANMKTMNYNGLKLYYVLNPEFTFIGDTKTSSGYAQFVIDEINMIRNANLPNVKIIRGFLVLHQDFDGYLPTIQTWANAHRTELSLVDYFGPDFNNQINVNSSVAADMINFLTTVKSYTGKSNFIPNSYVYWDTVYNGTTTGTDADAANFLNYLHANRNQLYNNAGVVAWCWSATLEHRGSTGFVNPQSVPTGGYPYPFGPNNTYYQAGIALANWMRDEAPYQIMNKNSGLVIGVPQAVTYVTNLVQGTPTWASDQQWVLVQLSSNGYYKLQNKHSGLVAAVAGASKSAGAIIKQGPDYGQSDAQWTIEDAGGGYWKIRNKNSGLLLNVVGSSMSVHAQLEQQTDMGISSELWQLNYLPAQ